MGEGRGWEVRKREVGRAVTNVPENRDKSCNGATKKMIEKGEGGGGGGEEGRGACLSEKERCVSACVRGRFHGWGEGGEGGRREVEGRERGGRE